MSGRFSSGNRLLHRSDHPFHPQPRRALESRDLAARQPLRHDRHDHRRAGHGVRPARHGGRHPLDHRPWWSAAPSACMRRTVVKMTQMPELVALMHSLVGLAACLVGFASYIDTSIQFTGAEKTIHEIEIYVGILIGAVTFSGSLIAFGKLSGKIGGKPLLLPARHWLNLVGLLVVIWFGRKFSAPIRSGRHDAADRDDRDRAAVRHPHGDGHRRRRHAGGGVDAQQLLGLGGGGDRLHAVERPADRHRRAGRFLRRDPVLHHVPRDEPQLHQRHRRRLRHRRRARRRPRAMRRSRPAKWSRSARPKPPNCCARPRA
jgi:hypothetical protein